MLCDQYHDPAFGMLYHLLQENPTAADFVKSANLNESDTTDLSDKLFAWPEKRLFPINSAENTVISSLYREKCAEVPADVDERLQKAAEIYEVQTILSAPRTKLAATSAPVIQEHVLLPRLGRLRVKTAEDIPVAETLLLRDYNRLNMEDRATGFTNLVKVARDMNVALKPETMRMAGMTVCTTKVAQELIEARRCATTVPAFQKAYEKLAATLDNQQETLHDRDDLVALADGVAKVDKQAGLDKQYDKAIPDPIRTVFNTTKLAEEMVDIAGRQMAFSQLAELPLDFWEDLVGPEMSQEIGDGTGGVDPGMLHNIIETLPLDLKVVLKNQVP